MDAFSDVFGAFGVVLIVAIIVCVLIGLAVGEGHDGFYDDW